MMEREDNLQLPLKVFYIGTLKMEDSRYLEASFRWSDFFHKAV